MQVTHLIDLLHRCKGKILTGCNSLSRGERLERHKPAASGLRRSER